MFLPLVWFNIGVEVAQIAVILVAATFFFFIKKKKKREFWQKAGSVLVTLAGIIWILQRAFGLDLTFGLL